MAASSAPAAAPPAVTGTAAPTPADRIRGVDLARALAILGMVMVHFGPFDPDRSTWPGRIYGFTSGRASVLFVLLAGVGVTLLFRGRPAQDARIRIAWRVVVFFPVGVALQMLPTPVAVILHFYAVYYLLGGVLAPLPTRWLTALTGAWAVLGPIAFLLLQDPSLAGRGDAASLGDPVRLVGDLLLTGYYPLITWAVPLLVGMLVARTDLRDPTTRWALLAGGAVVALAAYGGAAVAQGALDPDLAGSEWLLADAHSGAPLNVLGATGTAVAVLAGCLLLATWLPRLTWPLVAVGQMALSVYVGHLLVLAVGPTLLEDRASVEGAAFKVARFFLLTTALCALWRWRFARGPLEALVAWPFRQRRGGGSPHVGPGPHSAGEIPHVGSGLRSAGEISHVGSGLRSAGEISDVGSGQRPPQWPPPPPG